MDSHLPQMVKELHRLLSKIQRSISQDYLRLKEEGIEDLAGILVDFGADIHGGIGIWSCYERYNAELFGTPLPLTADCDSAKPLSGIHFERVRHLLWLLYQELSDAPVLSPQDEDIQCIAEVVQSLLSDKYASLPQDSGIKAFLATPNDYGWGVKRKLLWLGTKSYMFRIFFRQYILEQCDGESDIGHTDDFICQQCTQWSGLGVIDILAGVLDIDDDDRKDLRSWYERHAAPYKILSANTKVVKALNTISNQEYLIRINMNDHPFVPGLLVIGSLTPWKGEWYWSGEQRFIENPSQSLIGDLKNTMIRQSSSLVYRCSKEHEQKAMEQMAKLHSSALAFYGKDMSVYPDGLSMAADWQRELRQNWASRSPEVIKEVIRKHSLKHNHPSISIPKDILESKDGVGVFLNPDCGKEIMTNFNYMTAGFQRRGVGLSEDEEYAIRGFIRSDTLSPRFVLRMVDEYGDESIKSSFRLTDTNEGYWLDYLSRCYKGAFFRKCYPAISLV
jgi:hypothetical protein